MLPLQVSVIIWWLNVLFASGFRVAPFVSKSSCLGRWFLNRVDVPFNEHVWLYLSIYPLNDKLGYLFCNFRSGILTCFTSICLGLQVPTWYNMSWQKFRWIDYHLPFSLWLISIYVDLDVFFAAEWYQLDIKSVGLIYMLDLPWTTQVVLWLF